MQPASTICVAGTLRRATRSITRVYDQRLAAVGLTTTQFSLLRAIESYDQPIALSALAEDQVFERTSLYRALEPLERDGLISIQPGRGRARVVSLTEKGRRRIAEAVRQWTAAQEDFVSRFGRSAWTALSAQLIDIVEVARSMPAT